jgi:6-phosphogluconolactonase (cycloisomerase 2 family)
VTLPRASALVLFKIFIFFSLQLFAEKNLCANQIPLDPSPKAVISNPCPSYSLINSVEFHPEKNLFCVTYTQGNQVTLYKIDAFGKPEIMQTLSNPLANLSEPQHAIFSRDGEKLIVANWTNQTLTVYRREKNDFFREVPIAVIATPPQLKAYKPHGMALSPCGNFLAIAYGASRSYGKAIALFRMAHEKMSCELTSLLQGDDALPGIPKGITFSPDGSCLLVTFSDTNRLVIFDLEEKEAKILKTPRQTICDKATKISRPEDVKFSSDGNYCVISNSASDTVAFYPFDKKTNRITQMQPCYLLKNPDSRLCFPHGIAFSPDGLFLLITQFGPIKMTKEGDIFWDKTLKTDLSRIQIYTKID